ncbi:hypothetical protein [Aeromonas phage 14AhydR10PP]|nr:hypothetical protein [Aeromonas phage 14AhydR10PP]
MMPFVYSCHHAAARFVLNHPVELLDAILEADGRARPIYGPPEYVAKEVSRLLESAPLGVSPKLWGAVLKVVRANKEEFAQYLPLVTDVDLVISLIERSSNDRD